MDAADMKDSTDKDTSPAMPWGAVWILSVTQIVSWGSLFYAFSVLLSPIEQETGWGRDTVVGAFSLSLLLAGAGALPAGMLVDRFGGRKVMSLGSITAGVLLLGLARSESILAFYAAWAGLGVAMSLLLYEPAFAVIYANFGGGARKAITALTLIAGFASTVFWPLTQALVDAVGWRQTLTLMGLANLLVCVPLHLRLPAPRRAKPDRAAGSATAPRALLRHVLHTPSFWLLAVSFTANMLAFSALSVHLIPLLRERGLSASDAVLLAALIGPMQVLGRVLEFTVGVRFHATQVGLLALLMLPAALIALIFAGSSWSLILWFVILYGASNGVMTIVRAITPAELFGRESYGAINGALSAPVIASRAAGPLAASIVWSYAGGYQAVLWLLAGLGVVAVAGFGLAARGRKG